MSRFRLYATNALTAVVTAALTSIFWIAAYSGSVERPRGKAEPGSNPTAGSQAASAPLPIGKLRIGPTGLALPVAGIGPTTLVDTFSQARAGGARIHDAIDIMAPAGTPVLAAAPGRVEKLFFSKGGGGITAYVRSPDGRWSYYYAHLRDYAPGLHEGQSLRRGDSIGSVGSTGNASPEGPHLHFAIHRMERGERWYQGTAINPYPLLAGKPADREGPNPITATVGTERILAHGKE